MDTRLFIVACAFLFFGWIVFARIKAMQGLIRGRDRRQFFFFWFGPASAAMFLNFVPWWFLGQTYFLAIHIGFFVWITIDFVYYFVFRNNRQAPKQWHAGLLLIPAILFFFRDHLDPRQEILVALPHFGEARVWSDRAYWAETYYFLDAGSRALDRTTPKYEDPNYGKAIFSPVNGTFEYLDDRGAVVLSVNQENGARLALGPFIPASVRLKPGDPVHISQPLGLADRAEAIPGIFLQIKQPAKLRFQNSFSGHWWLWFHKKAVLKRNQRVSNRGTKSWEGKDMP